MAGRQNLQQLPRAPVGVRPPGGAQQLGEGVVDPVGAVVWGAAPIGEPTSALLLVASQPLVADPAADAVPGAQRGHREVIARGIANELQALFHGNSLQPRHRRASLSRVSSCSLLTTRTPEARAFALKKFREYPTRGLFAPPSAAGTIVYPGYDGGGEWGGPAYDPPTIC